MAVFILGVVIVLSALDCLLVYIMFLLFPFVDPNFKIYVYIHEDLRLILILAS